MLLVISKIKRKTTLNKYGRHVMYRVKNPYGECNLMSLNMIDVCERKTLRISAAEITLMLTPFIAIAVIAAAFVTPDFSFFAECQNVPGGDLCSITMR